MNLFYETTGKGTVPLVALHGGYGLDHTYFRPWLDETAAHVILPDGRGCGQSPRTGLETADLAQLAADLEELREQLGFQKWIVLGHSFGSFVAQEYAFRHPERVEKLILVGSAPALDYPEIIGKNLAERGTARQGQLMQQALTGQLATDAEFRAGWNELLPLYFHRFDPAVAARLDAPARYSAPALIHGFRMLSQWSGLSRLGQLKMPVLLASGADDFITPPAQGLARLQHGIPHAQAVVFNESGHFPFIEEPALFSRVLAGFL